MGGRNRGGNEAVGISTGKLLGYYLCEERVGDEVRILLQARVADGDKSGHRRGEKTDLEGWGLVVSIRLSSRLGQRGTYKNEDGICTFFPVLHIFLVELLGTGGIHIEDGSRRVTVIGPARSHGDAIGRHVGDVADQTFTVRCGFILAPSTLRWQYGA